MNTFLLGALDIAAFLLCATFLAYVLVIVLSLMRHRAGPQGDPGHFGWHFFIPCLNEERVIEGTVGDLFKKFPAAHLWCIDDGSTDATPAILARLSRRSPRIHVVTRRLPDAQGGKGPALNAAWRALVDYLPADADLERVIVGVIDADGILDPSCPAVIAGPGFFGDRRVGAVQILVRVVNFAGDRSAKVRILTRMQDLEFTTIIAGMQMLRRHVGSTSMGGNGQFTRASALQTVSQQFGMPWEKALLEDFELGLRILLTGGLTEYCHDTWVAQHGVATIRRLMRQRSRWAQGLMQCFRYFWPVMRSPGISTPAALEIGYFLLLPWFQLIGILVYTASFAVIAYYALNTVGGITHWFGNGAWGLIPLFILFGIGPLVIWGPIYRRTVARNLRFRQAAVLGLLNWPYIYVHHASTIWAFARMLRSRHDWKKTERVDIRKHQPVRPAPAVNTATHAPAAARVLLDGLADDWLTAETPLAPAPVLASTVGAGAAPRHPKYMVPPRQHPPRAQPAGAPPMRQPVATPAAATTRPAAAPARVNAAVKARLPAVPVGAAIAPERERTVQGRVRFGGTALTAAGGRSGVVGGRLRPAPADDQPAD